MNVDRQLAWAASAAALDAGLGEISDFEPVVRAGGGNNRGFRVSTAAGTAFLKQYFRDPADPRDRLKAETEFVRFARDASVTQIPRLLAADPDSGVALFEWIEGRRFAPGEIGVREVDAALDFFAHVNAARATPAARALGAASEACFSIAEHLGVVGHRVNLLARESEEPARAFARTKLVPAWERVLERVGQSLAEEGVEAGQAIPAEQRCVSPSDFGFHNALACADGRIVFHDFEYAGWDDPAKLVGDFFAQVAVPVPAECTDRFVDKISDVLALGDAARARIAMLRPVYRIKWCCIVLNDFLPDAGRRRAFAAQAEATDAAHRRKLDQLGKAASVLEGVSEL